MTHTPGHARTIRIAAFAGSLRKDSYNRALLRATQELAPDGLRIDIFDLEGVPLYNADVEETGDPERVAMLKAAIRAADGVLIATPEYNHGVPAVTKNAVDWASRPPRSAPLDGKPVGIIGASPGMTGSARGQSQLRQAFEFTNSICMPQPEILVARAHEKFDDGRLTDEPTRQFLARYLEALLDFITRVLQAPESHPIHEPRSTKTPIVDEAGEDSFPASDPPAWTGTTAT